jgi:hypothetical protein
MRDAERRLAEQAQASYERMVRDWKAATPKKKAGASATPGAHQIRPYIGA